MTPLDTIRSQIATDPMNAELTARGYQPVYTVSAEAKIMIVGQAPGVKAQLSDRPFNDQSGIRLRKWLGVSDEQFYDPKLFALVPMDFYYPGKGAHGDLPPRPGFAATWHPLLLKHMPRIELILLVGNYAQKYYLGSSVESNLTQTVMAYKQYLPTFIPIVHPSPLNFRWLKNNPWFEAELVPELQTIIHRVI